MGFLFIQIGCRSSESDTKQNNISADQKNELLVNPLGRKLFTEIPPAIYLNQYKEAKEKYDADPSNLENIIWYGRRTAYIGKYNKAIEIYSNGLELFPEESRLLRHRGHRYISLRRFDKAIEDLEKAAKLIEGQPNQIEQDGLPNAQNIPLSTQHGNIYYHLGLAYYLKQDFEKAFQAYTLGRKTGNNDDNLVSTTHWLYMIQRRMGNKLLAEKQLDPIHEDMKVIENQSYYDLCLFYKGLIPRDSLLNEEGTPSGDAVKYGLANWDLYNERLDKAILGYHDILEGKSWSSFGYITAEQDYIQYFKE
jgi:tetratricopeptide (TPR) repeat protein